MRFKNPRDQVLGTVLSSARILQHLSGNQMMKVCKLDGYIDGS